MKWIVTLLVMGLLGGIAFPDYRFGPNKIIIPFCIPLFLASTSAYFYATKRLRWNTSGAFGLLSLYLSRFAGIIVYGLSVGWQYVTDDAETHAVIMATIAIQTFTYLVGFGVFVYIAKRYNKPIQPTPKSGAADG